MALYDSFSDAMRSHGPFVRRMEAKRQERILHWIMPFLRDSSMVRVLEVGVGIGLFARCCQDRKWFYLGIDRNDRLARELGANLPVIVSEVPPLPAAVECSTFDLVYSAFVFEHLSDGLEGYKFVCEMRKALKPGGVLALVVPDALSLDMEFWNLDYTHRYPTSDRNMHQILSECGLKVERMVRYRGAGWTGLFYWFVRCFGAVYSYRFWRGLIRDRILPYSVYQYLRVDSLVFICRVD